MLPPQETIDLRRLVSETFSAFELVGDGLAQFRDATGRRVFCEPGGERLGGSILDELRRVKIRFTGAKADNIPRLLLSWPWLSERSASDSAKREHGAKRQVW